MKFYLIISFFSVSFFSSLQAQRPASGAWLAVQMPVSLGKKWQWHQDAGYRTDGISLRPSQYLYRTGAKYLLSSEWSVTSGIAFFFTKSLAPAEEGEFGKEFRIWQELNWTNQEESLLQWQIRGRVEQRFFAATKFKSSSYADRFRLRAAVTGKFIKKWSWQFANEWMEQIRSGSLGFDQYRLILSVIRKGKRQSQWQTGLMWLKWPNESQGIITVSYQKTISLHGS